MNNIIFAILLIANTNGVDPLGNRTVPIDQIQARRTEVLQGLVDRVSSLSSREQLSLYLGSMPSSGRGGKSSASSSVRLIQKDPALRQHFEKIETSWLLRPSESQRTLPSASQLVELKVMVARNLFFRGLDPSASAVVEEVERIEAARKQFAALPILSGRTVLFGTSPDLLEDGRRVFGRLPTLSYLKAESGRLVNLEDSVRADRIERLILQTPQLTFVFEGHSDGRSLKLGQSMPARRLAKFLAGRPADFPSPIIILDTCLAHDYARRLNRELVHLQTGAALPILVVPDEMGQLLIKEIFSAGFLRFDVNARSSKGGPTTLGDLFAVSARRVGVYAPDPRNVLRQIS